MESKFFLSSLSALLLFSLSGNSSASEGTEAPPFIQVKSKGERPLGSSYVLPYYSKRINKTKGLDKNQVLIHKNGVEFDIPTQIEIRNASYEQFNFRGTESTSDSETSFKAKGNLEEDLGEFMSKFHRTSKNASNELSLDLFSFFSPYSEELDKKMTKFRELKKFQRFEGSPFEYKCIYAENGGEDKVYDCTDRDNTYLPASVDSRHILSMCGTHIIREHFHGVVYRRTIKFVFSSKKEKNEFASKFKADLNSIRPDTAADFAGKLKAEYTTKNSDFHVDGMETNYYRFLSFLEKQGYEDLVQDFEEKQSTLMKATDIEDAILAAYDLHDILVRINTVAGRFDYSDPEFDSMFPVIAVSPDSHTNACISSFPDLVYALTFAWNRVTGQQSLREKKEKSSKI